MPSPSPEPGRPSRQAQPAWFTLDESRLAELADNFEIVTDHDALLALETAIQGDSYRPPVLSGPCEIAVDLLENSDGETDGYRALLRPDPGADAPWLASGIQRVSDHRGDGLDTAGIIADFARLASSLFSWHQGHRPADVSPRDAAELAAQARSLGLQPADLAGLVNDTASTPAAEANNGGLESQIRFLVQAHGREAAESLVRSCRPAVGRQRPRDRRPEPYREQADRSSRTAEPEGYKHYNSADAEHDATGYEPGLDA